MKRLVPSPKIRIAAFAGVLCLLLIANQYSAAYAQQPGSTSTITGRYVDQSGGIWIDLPNGWSGTKMFGQFLIVSPLGIESNNDLPEVVMAVIVVDRSAMGDRIMSMSTDITEVAVQAYEGGDDNCRRETTAYEKIGGTTAFHVVQECKDEGEGHYSKTRAYAAITLTKIVIIAYAADSASAYGNHIDEFEQSIKTLHFDEPIDFRTGLLTLAGASKVYPHTVNVKGKDVSVRIETSSRMSNFNFSEEEKRISFRVDGNDGTAGTLIMPLQGLLSGPYMVTIDGEPADDFLVIEDKTTGEQLLHITYTHSVHDIAITGASVVPEFPVHLVAMMGAILGVIALLSRTRSILPRGY